MSTHFSRCTRPQIPQFWFDFHFSGQPDYRLPPPSSQRQVAAKYKSESVHVRPLLQKIMQPVSPPGCLRVTVVWLAHAAHVRPMLTLAVWPLATLPELSSSYERVSTSRVKNNNKHLAGFLTSNSLYASDHVRHALHFALLKCLKPHEMYVFNC